LALIKLLISEIDVNEGSQVKRKRADVNVLPEKTFQKEEQMHKKNAVTGPKPAKKRGKR
jgi:hypothetical protein